MSNNLDRFTNVDSRINNAEATVEHLSKLREKFAQKSSNLNAEAKSAEEDFQAVDQLVGALKKGQFAQILELHERMPQIFTRISNSDPNLAEILKKIFLNANEECQKIAREYPTLIQEASRREQLQIDQTSTHPKYTFCERFLILEVDDKKFKAKAYTREGNLFVKPFDVSLIIPALKQEISRIFGRPFNPRQFAKTLYSNYNSIIKNEKKRMGDQIPIRKITTRLGKNQKNFRTDEFIVDLSRLIENGATSIYGYKIDLGHTKDDRSGVLLYRLETHGYIGFISIKKEEKI
ncbi:MAG: hypothetical protein AB1665_01530 [Candidatus Thermoplasmatota archaeon]